MCVFKIDQVSSRNVWLAAGLVGVMRQKAAALASQSFCFFTGLQYWILP